MSSLKTKRIQVGSHATPENNFGIVQPDTPDGSLRVGQGNLGALTELLKLDGTALDVLADLQVGGDQVAEYGSNSNGEYVRFYDGTQVCWERLTENVSSHDWTFPSSFTSDPVVIPSILGVSSNNYIYLCVWRGVSQTGVTITKSYWGGSSWGRASGEDASAVAIGRWK